MIYTPYSLLTTGLYSFIPLETPQVKLHQNREPRRPLTGNQPLLTPAQTLQQPGLRSFDVKPGGGVVSPGGQGQGQCNSPPPLRSNPCYMS